MGDLGQPENHQRGGGDERRMQALRQGHPVERGHHDHAAEQADQGAEERLADELQHDMRRGVLSHRQPFDQHQRQEHRERIVGAGFDLERRADAGAQAQALGMDQQEHRRGVGRRHHGADQQCFGPFDAKGVFGDRRGDQRGQQHTAGGEQCRGREHGADAGKSGLQPAVEQDQPERDRADQIGQAHVVELQAARTAATGENTDPEEHQQQGGTEPQRQQTRQDARHHQGGAEQDRNADGIERRHE